MLCRHPLSFELEKLLGALRAQDECRFSYWRMITFGCHRDIYIEIKILKIIYNEIMIIFIMMISEIDLNILLIMISFKKLKGKIYFVNFKTSLRYFKIIPTLLVMKLNPILYIHIFPMENL